MQLWHYLCVLVQSALLISSAPISSELDAASIHIASRTAQPQALPQIANYVLLHPNFRPSVSVTPSPTPIPQHFSNLSSTYHIPATRTTLHLDLLEGPIELQLLKRVLLRMSAHLREHKNAHGDGWLLPEDDPYTVSLPGCTFFAKSNPNPVQGRQQHLTYGILSSVAAGLWQWMIIGDRVKEVRFEIEDSSWGIVGMGIIAPYENDGDEKDGTHKK